MRFLNKTEVAQLQEAVETLETDAEVSEYIRFIDSLCAWCDVATPDWSYRCNRTHYLLSLSLELKPVSPKVVLPAIS